MKHVVIILCDQMRKDAIHCLGNRDILTPALDQLASESIVFDKAYTPSPVCVPARISLMTGQYCNRTGNNSNTTEMCYDGAGFYSTLTNAGYQSCCIGKMHYLPDMYGALGFERRYSQEEFSDPEDDYYRWLQSTPYANVFDYHGQRTELYYVPQVSQLPAEAHPTQWIGDVSVNFIENYRADQGRPMFLMSSFIHPHPPFAPPAPWNKLYRNLHQEAFVPDVPCDNYADLLRNRYTLAALDISTRDLDLLREHYYACISFVDYQIGRITAALKEKGIYDDTLIVFTSDHGELLGDYGSMGKRTMLDPAANIPLLIKYPGREHGIRKDPVSLVDIAPTLLSYCSCEYDKRQFDGINIFENQHTEVYSQYGSGSSALYMIASSQDKLIYSGSNKTYYYFNCFPEKTNRYDDSTPRIQHMKALLEEHMRCDVCCSAQEAKIISPLYQPQNSFYPPLDDHAFTSQAEKNRMPVGYDITLKSE